jgi:hypothetical protein
VSAGEAEMGDSSLSVDTVSVQATTTMSPAALTATARRALGFSSFI